MERSNINKIMYQEDTERIPFGLMGGNEPIQRDWCKCGCKEGQIYEDGFVMYFT